jgi:hypothetical protein
MYNDPVVPKVIFIGITLGIHLCIILRCITSGHSQSLVPRIPYRTKRAPARVTASQHKAAANGWVRASRAPFSPGPGSAERCLPAMEVSGRYWGAPAGRSRPRFYCKLPLHEVPPPSTSATARQITSQRGGSWFPLLPPEAHAASNGTVLAALPVSTVRGDARGAPRSAVRTAPISDSWLVGVDDPPRVATRVPSEAVRFPSAGGDWSCRRCDAAEARHRR